MIQGFHFVVGSFGTALLIPFIHWLTTVSYSHFCVQPTLYGLIQSMFTMSSPPCQCLLKIMNSTSEMYIAIWISVVFASIGTLSGFVETFINKPNRKVSISNGNGNGKGKEL